MLHYPKWAIILVLRAQCMCKVKERFTHDPCYWITSTSHLLAHLLNQVILSITTSFTLHLNHCTYADLSLSCFVFYCSRLQISSKKKKPSSLHPQNPHIFSLHLTLPHTDLHTLWCAATLEETLLLSHGCVYLCACRTISEEFSKLWISKVGRRAKNVCSEKKAITQNQIYTVESPVRLPNEIIS